MLHIYLMHVDMGDKWVVWSRSVQVVLTLQKSQPTSSFPARVWHLFTVQVGTCWGQGRGDKMKAREEGKVWHKQIMNRWCDMWKCETWRQEGSEEEEKKRQLSGVDSAWLLVNSSWSQQEGKSLSDKVASFLSAPKERALRRRRLLDLHHKMGK